MRRWQLIWLPLAGLMSPSVAFGKCAMCARNASAAGEAAGGLGPLLGAALLLLIPTITLFLGVGFLAWKQR